MDNNEGVDLIKTNKENLLDVTGATEQTPEVTAQERALDLLNNAPEPIDELGFVGDIRYEAFSGLRMAKNLKAIGADENDLPDTFNDEPVTDSAIQYYNVIKNMTDDELGALSRELRAEVRISAQREYDQYVESWNNPTGLLTERVAYAMTPDLSKNYQIPCEEPGCSHSYRSDVFISVMADDGTGNPASDTERIYLSLNTPHVLSEHPTADVAIRDARAIVKLSEASLANR